MPAIELSAGRIDYEDTGGDGPVLVLLHGLLMDSSLWDAVTADLAADFRVVVPTLPLGAHRHPTAADADLSLTGIARLAGELLDRLDLTDATVAGNDTGGALVQLLAVGSVSGDGFPGAGRIGRIALISCDAFGNFPPGLTGRALVTAGKLPPAIFGAFMQQMRLKAVRRLPIAFGWLTRRGDKVSRRWLEPVLTSPEIRRDTVRVLRAIAAEPGLLERAADRLPDFGRPALVAWAAQDRVMPPAHGTRLAGLLPNARLIEIDDSYTLIPLDQPGALARALREFMKSLASDWSPGRARAGGSLGAMELHVGCAMWTYAPWQGRFLPPSLPPRERLAAYATWCNAVEGNTTFYATPATDTVRSWAGQTAPGFRFILKLPKAVTHERRFADVTDIMRTYLAAIEPLGPRAHSLWVQLPPSFGPGDVGALTGFLRRLPREYRYCVEVRHREFFTDPRAGQQFERALSGFDAEWVTFDTTVLFATPPASEAEREAWGKKPRVPRRSRALTAHPVVRYIGRDDSDRTAAGWQPWLDTVTGWLREGRSPTVFIHTPDNVDSLELARRFHGDMRARVPEIDPLPEPVPAGPPTLF